MNRTTLQVGTFEVNCSVLAQGTRALIVDPGAEAERIAAFLDERKIEPAAVLLTHAHFDHIGGVPGLLKVWPHLPVCVSDEDAEIVCHPLNQYPPDYPPFPKLKFDRRTPEALAEEFGYVVISTPGHTPGGVCYHFPAEKLLLSGDTLFAGSVGRTDLPGGDMKTLTDSLEKLTALPDETRVVPGHGPETTIRLEKAENPFLL